MKAWRGRALRRVWHWINGALAHPRLVDRYPSETAAAYAERCKTFLAESAAYQDQNMRLAVRNMRAVLALALVTVVIALVATVVQAVR